MSNELSIVEQNQTPATIEEVTKQVHFIQEIMRSVMKEGEHWGKVPGCGDKPALLKPGAEKLGFTFRLRPEFQVTRIDHEKGHREYEVICHLSNGTEGVGTCATLEGKFRFREASRKCPNCGKESIIKGKEEYGGGWLCYSKKGGCGSKWPKGAQEIEAQVVGKVEHDNPADYYNTCLKMAKKRAHVDAILTATAASDIFAQDIDETLPETESPPKKPISEPNNPTLEENVKKVQEINQELRDSSNPPITKAQRIFFEQEIKKMGYDREGIPLRQIVNHVRKEESTKGMTTGEMQEILELCRTMKEDGKNEPA